MSQFQAFTLKQSAFIQNRRIHVSFSQLVSHGLKRSYPADAVWNIL